MASGALAAGLSAGRDRRRVLLGRRHRFEHAAAARARPARHAARASSSRSTSSRPSGEMPATMADVGEREKDIRFSSRTRLNTAYELKRQATLQAAQRLLAKLPARLARRSRRQSAGRLAGRSGRVCVVHLIYRSKHYESQSKDYEFSRASMLEHWSSGLADTLQTSLDDPRWKDTQAAVERWRRKSSTYCLEQAGRRNKTVTPTTPYPEDPATHEQADPARQDRLHHRRRQRHRQGNRHRLRERRRQGRPSPT